MTPLEKRAEEMSGKLFDEGRYVEIEAFEQGFKDFKDQPEVKALVEALTEARYELWVISCATRLGNGEYIQMENALAAKNALVQPDKALKAWGEFTGESK